MADFEQQRRFGGFGNANFDASLHQGSSLFDGWKNNDMLLSNNSSSTYMFKKFASVRQVDGNLDNKITDFNDGTSSSNLSLQPNAAATFGVGNGPAWMNNATLSNPTNWATIPTFDANNRNSENTNANISVISNFAKNPRMNSSFSTNNNFCGDFSINPQNSGSANSNFSNPLNSAGLLYLNNRKGRSVYQFDALPYTFNLN
uniref:Uncharacterized protein n=1 Tax=Parascaris univalens TaxID=6257 RepID=A0A915APM7_PARUN